MNEETSKNNFIYRISPIYVLKYSFDNTKNLFFKNLKKKVDEYFQDRELHPAGNGKLYLKSAL